MNLNSRINTLIMRGLSATEATAQAEHEARVSELTETGSSVRYTGRPIMTMIAEALGPDEPDAR